MARATVSSRGVAQRIFSKRPEREIVASVFVRETTDGSANLELGWLLRSEGRSTPQGEGGTERAGGDLPLRQHRESAHLAGAVQLRLQDPPTPTGDEKGRENERRESLRGITVAALARTTDREREGGRKRGETMPGLDAEISVTYARPAKISTPKIVVQGIRHIHAVLFRTRRDKRRLYVR